MDDAGQQPPHEHEHSLTPEWLLMSSMALQHSLYYDIYLLISWMFSCPALQACLHSFLMAWVTLHEPCHTLMPCAPFVVDRREQCKHCGHCFWPRAVQCSYHGQHLGRASCRQLSSAWAQAAHQAGVQSAPGCAAGLHQSCLPLKAQREPGALGGRLSPQD